MVAGGHRELTPARRLGLAGRWVPLGSLPGGDSWWWVLPEASPGSLTDVERWNASLPSREGGDGPLSKPWTCNCRLPLCGEGEGDSQRRSFIKQTGFDSFCPCAGVFFPFPPKHPKHFQPLAQRSESGGASSPNREWVAGFALMQAECGVFVVENKPPSFWKALVSRIAQPALQGAAHSSEGYI